MSKACKEGECYSIPSVSGEREKMLTEKDRLPVCYHVCAFTQCSQIFSFFQAKSEIKNV